MSSIKNLREVHEGSLSSCSCGQLRAKAQLPHVKAPQKEWRKADR
jgi:hypothetical protein